MKIPYHFCDFPPIGHPVFGPIMKPPGEAKTLRTRRERRTRTPRTNRTTHIAMEWHGWNKPDEMYGSLHIGKLPGRKGIALYYMVKGSVSVLAYFKSHECAAKASYAIDQLTGTVDQNTIR